MKQDTDVGAIFWWIQWLVLMSVSQTKIIANHKSGERSKPGGTRKTDLGKQCLELI